MRINVISAGSLFSLRMEKGVEDFLDIQGEVREEFFQISQKPYLNQIR